MTRTLADEYRDLATRAPSFTGMYLDSTGKFTVLIASDTVGDFSMRQIMSLARRRSALVRGSTMPRLRRAEFSYRQLDSVYSQVLGPAIGRLEYVTASGISDQRGTINIGLDDVSRSAEIRRIALQHDVPLRMLTIRHRRRINLLEAIAQCYEDCGAGSGGGGGGGGACTGTNLQGCVRPMHGGLQIQRPGPANLGICTVGFTGYGQDQVTRYALTASHCFLTQDSVTPNAPFGQPDSVPANHFGVEFLMAPVMNNGCPMGFTRCQHADVGVIRYNAADLTGYGLVKKAKTNNITITGLESVYNQLYGETLVGAQVCKVGRTTGRNCGLIQESCENINYAPRNDILTICATEVALNACGGDSGSPVFVQEHPQFPYETPRAVGIIVAAVCDGNVTYYSGMNQIFNAIGYGIIW